MATGTGLGDSLSKTGDSSCRRQALTTVHVPLTSETGRRPKALVVEGPGSHSGSHHPQQDFPQLRRDLSGPVLRIKGRRFSSQFIKGEQKEVCASPLEVIVLSADVGSG